MTRERKPFIFDQKWDDGEVRHYYEDSEVVTDIDLGTELAAHDAGYEARSSKSGGLPARKRALKALVGQGGMTPAQAEAQDPEAYNECFETLDKLHARYLRKPENRPPVGKDYYQASVLVTAESGHGKGPLADAFLREMQVLAAHGGSDWTIAEPAGRQAIEGIRGSELVLHDDARYWMLPTSDEFYRYLDPNRSSESDTRYSPTAGVSPRAVVLTTSNTLYEFALTVVTRKPSEVLADAAEGKKPADLRPRNIDESLRRLGWCLEPRTPGWVLEQEGRIPKPDFLALLGREMVVMFYRVRKTSDRRIEAVYDRNGALLGRVSTDRDLELVAMVKGLDRASRFLASSVMPEYSPDVAAFIPDDVMAEYTSDYVAIEQQGNADYAARVVDEVRSTFGHLAADHFAAAHSDGLRTQVPVSGDIFTMTTGEVVCALCKAAPQIAA